MRIRIIGDSDSAIAVRGMLRADRTVVVCDHFVSYTVEITGTYQPLPTIDGVDSDWERKFIQRICTAANTNVILLRSGGNQSDEYMRIGIPSNVNAALVERGILQAILQMVQTPRLAPPEEVEARSSWWTRLWKNIFRF